MTHRQWKIYYRWLNMCKELDYLWNNMEQDLKELARNE